MGLLSRLFNRAGLPAPTAAQLGNTHMVSADAGRIDRWQLATARLRQGMWVTYNGQVGILDAASITGSDNVTRVIPLFVPVQPDGQNFVEVINGQASRVTIRVDLSTVRQAKLAEIPPVRMHNAEMFRAMGYGD